MKPCLVVVIQVASQLPNGIGWHYNTLQMDVLEIYS